LAIAAFASDATVRSRLHAIEYFEWMCRSAIQPPEARSEARVAGVEVGTSHPDMRGLVGQRHHAWSE
jgi:hypothetical protein